MKKLNTVEKIVTYLEEIPEEQWCRDVYTDEQGRHCFLGHLGFRQIKNLKVADYHWDVLKGRGIDVGDIVDSNNNSPLGPKNGAISVLKKYVL